MNVIVEPRLYRPSRRQGGQRAQGEMVIGKKFKVGDQVTWNSEAGHVSGTIIRVHTADVIYKGYVHHATADAPQYEIKSSKTDHIAMHKGAVLRRVRE
jgi:hypothetical protein